MESTRIRRHAKLSSLNKKLRMEFIIVVIKPHLVMAQASVHFKGAERNNNADELDDQSEQYILTSFYSESWL